MITGFMTKRQAAEYLGLSPGRVQVFITTGRLSSRMFAGMHLIPRREVYRFARKARKNGAPKRTRT